VSWCLYAWKTTEETVLLTPSIVDYFQQFHQGVCDFSSYLDSTERFRKTVMYLDNEFLS